MYQNDSQISCPSTWTSSLYCKSQADVEQSHANPIFTELSRDLGGSSTGRDYSVFNEPLAPTKIDGNKG